MVSINAIDYGKRVLKGGSLIFLGMLLSAFFGLIFRALLAKNLTPADYGLFFYIYSFLSFFTLFYDLGMCKSLARHLPIFLIKKEYKKVKSSIIGVGIFELVFSLFFATIFFVFSNYFATSIFENSNAVLVFQLMCVWMVLNSLYRVLGAVLQGYQDMKAIALVRTSFNIGLLIFAFLFVMTLKLGINGVALGYISATFLVFLSFATYTGRKYKKSLSSRFHLNFQLIKKLLMFALPIFIGSISFIIFENVDTLIIGALRTNDEVGFYQAAQPIARILWYIPSALSTVLFPMISEIWAKREQKILEEGTRFLLKFSLIILMPLVLVTIAFPEIIIRLVFSEAYLPAATALQILVFGALAYMLFVIVSVFLTGIGKPKTVMYVALVMAAINVVTNIALVRWIGINGSAIAHVLTYGFGSTTLLLVLKRFVKFKVPWSSMLKSIIGGCIILVLIYWFKQVLILSPLIEMLIIGVLGAFAYVAWILLTHTIDMLDLKLISQLIPLPSFILKWSKKLVK